MKPSQIGMTEEEEADLSRAGQKCHVRRVPCRPKAFMPEV